MKNMTRGIVFLLVAFATSVTYGGQPPRGVAGVDVIVKQNPSKRAMTDTRGNFALDGLAPGSYTLSFKARKAKEDSKAPADKVTVADSYAIKIDGTKRAVTASNLTSNKLITGVDLLIQVGPNARVRGQVAATGLKKMVWIAKEPGSHIPGHWAEADSVEAKRAFKSSAYGASGDGLKKWMENAGDMHQEGFPIQDLGNRPNR